MAFFSSSSFLKDPVPDHAQKALASKEPLDLALEVARLLVPPVEQVLPLQAPGGAVVEVEQVGRVKDLRRRHHLRRLGVIAADLHDPVVDALARTFGLDDHQGDAVDEEDDVSPVRLAAVGELPLVRHVEAVAFELVRIELDHSHIAVALLGLDVDRALAAHPAKDLGVPFDVGPGVLDALDDRVNVVGRHDAGIQVDQLLAQDAMEKQSRRTPPLRQRILLRKPRPPDGHSMADERLLDGLTLAEHYASPGECFDIVRRSLLTPDTNTPKLCD
jgi:hypothetical protein